MKRVTFNVPLSKKKKARELLKKMRMKEVISYRTEDVGLNKKTQMFSVLVTDTNVNSFVDRVKTELKLGKSIKEGVMTVEDTLMATPDITEKKESVAPQLRIKKAVANFSSLSKYELNFLILATMIASFGILINNFFIVVGAMLIAPIMNPIISSSFSFSKNNKKLLLTSLKSQIWNYTIVFLISLFIGVTFLKISTPFFDYYLDSLLIYFSLAFVIGIAAALAFVSEQIVGFVGVAVSIALLPPLVIIGLALAFNNFQAAFQALRIFILNIIGMHLGAFISFNVLKHKV